MEHVDTLICARWVIPIEPPGRVIDNGCIAVAQGRIVAVLEEREADRRFDCSTRVVRPFHVLVPGFVNTHTHAASALLRGLAEDLALDDWVRKRIGPLERRWVDAEYVRDGTELALSGMVSSGTTCFADSQLFPEIVASTAAAMCVRVCIGLPVTDATTIWAGDADECLDKGLRLHDEYRADPLVSTAFAPHALSSVCDQTLLRVRRDADEIDIPVMVHLHESAEEVAESLRRHAATPLERLARLGLVNPLLVGVHMTQLAEGDFERLAGAGASVVHCPQSNLKLANGFCPVTQLLARGINVALGTEGAASNNDFDMLEEMRTAALVAKGLSANASLLPAHQALRMATLNGARALGLAEVTGSLEPGKWADICCIDLDSVHTQPVYDPAAQVVFAAGREQVSDVWIAGRAVLTDGRLERVNVGATLARARAWGERIKAWTT